MFPWLSEGFQNMNRKGIQLRINFEQEKTDQWLFNHFRQTSLCNNGELSQKMTILLLVIIFFFDL